MADDVCTGARTEFLSDASFYYYDTLLDTNTSLTFFSIRLRYYLRRDAYAIGSSWAYFKSKQYVAYIFGSQDPRTSLAMIGKAT